MTRKQKQMYFMKMMEIDREHEAEEQIAREEEEERDKNYIFSIAKNGGYGLSY